MASSLSGVCPAQIAALRDRLLARARLLEDPQTSTAGVGDALDALAASAAAEVTATGDGPPD